MNIARYVPSDSSTKEWERIDEQFIETTKLDIHHIKELPIDSGVNKKWKITFSNGLSALFKPGVQFDMPYQKWPERSFVSFKIDRLFQINLIPSTVIINADVGRGAERGSAMIWIENAIALAGADWTKVDKPDDLKLLDALIGNRDRKPSDCLIDQDEFLYAIDNDSTFRHKDIVRGRELPVWQHEIATIASSANRREFLTRLRSASLESIDSELSLLNSDDQDRIREAFGLILELLETS